MFTSFAHGQSKVDSATALGRPDLGRLPGYLLRYAQSVGDRLLKAGSERGSFVGQLQAPGGSKQTTQWIWEYPGKLRLQRAGAARPIIFQPSVPLDKTTANLDETLAEVLAADTTEFFLEAVVTGSIPRWLGDDFRVTDRTGFGSTVNLIQLGALVNARTQPGQTAKHFAFDAATGMLARVHYARAGGTLATTEYSGYESFGRSAGGGILVPRTIVHRQGKTSIFELVIESAQWGPAIADNLFTGASV